VGDEILERKMSVGEGKWIVALGWAIKTVKAKEGKQP